MPPIFSYGTLRAAPLISAVIGRETTAPVAALLTGYAVTSVAGQVVPRIAKSEGAVAEGMLYTDLSGADMERLDLYESAFGYQLTDVTVQTEDGSVAAKCYLPPDDLTAGPDPWDFDAWQGNHMVPAVLAAQELFAHDPLPDAQGLRAMWPMIEMRAWSCHRATAAPATVRYNAGPDDFPLVAARPPQGRFFRYQSVDIRHSRFDGTPSPVLTREGFIGVDAAVILPYDPARDKVLLVEQPRLGPRLRHDPNPWMLEPVAGIVDAREHPDQTALRECREEAGLQIDGLESAAQFYVSPGSSTDYFYCYVGLCDLPQDAPYHGGLAQEAEDLRLHPVAFDTAMDLADSGEIATGPAQFLLYWLLRHRDRLRA